MSADDYTARSFWAKAAAKARTRGQRERQTYCEAKRDAAQRRINESKRSKE